MCSILSNGLLGDYWKIFVLLVKYFNLTKFVCEKFFQDELQTVNLQLLYQAMDNEEQDEKIFETLMSNLRNLTSKLLDIISELDDIVGKMNKIIKKLKAIHDLSEVQSSECNDMDEDLIRLMPKLSEASQEIEQMYKADMKIKSGIAKEICILKFESQLTFFEFCWEYEPKINKEKLFSLLAPIIFGLKLQSTCLHLI
ncbi:hypothetical protein CEXT_436581 [Caerostris extrusa]|uniref:Uncharacterized protein n=1 Tax=Caerostris extrusa TaxID=172846 RepID=A0AAV4M6P6_CAEEX|nr:hypothetical protein CEXT_436581 [Caerostris extrusa]